MPTFTATQKIEVDSMQEKPNGDSVRVVIKKGDVVGVEFKETHTCLKVGKQTFPIENRIFDDEVDPFIAELDAVA